MSHKLSSSKLVGEHLPEQRLAEASTLGYGNELRAAEKEHLFGCERCFATLAELARVQVVFAQQSDLMAVPEELLREVRQIPEEVTAKPPVYRLRNAFIGRDGARPKFASGVALLVALVFLSVIPFTRESSDVIDSDRLRPTIDWSSEPMAVYGREDPSLIKIVALRSAAQFVDEQLETLKVRYRETPDPEIAVQLISLAIASGYFEDGRLYTIHAMQQFPDEPRLWVLRANIYRTERDLEHAEHLLRRASREDPDDFHARFNLGIVLLQRGDPEGTSLLADSAQSDDDTPLARRARALLNKLD